MSSRQVLRSFMPSQRPAVYQQPGYKPARVLHGGQWLVNRLVTSQRGLRLLCCAAATSGDSDASDNEPMPRL